MASSKNLDALIRASKTNLENFIEEKNPAISSIVAAPFGVNDGLAKGFCDDTWLGETGDDTFPVY